MYVKCIPRYTKCKHFVYINHMMYNYHKFYVNILLLFFNVRIQLNNSGNGDQPIICHMFTL